MHKPEDAENTSGGSVNETPRKFEISGGQDIPEAPQTEDITKIEATVVDIPNVNELTNKESTAPAEEEAS